jgi:hypothetical protein
MDESYDRVRTVRDVRYRYVRNLAPGVDEAGKVAYQEVGQTMHELRRVQSEGGLTPLQSLYFATDRPREQLFDTLNDPWETKDLAADPSLSGKLAELRAECDRWIDHCGPKGEMSVEELVSKGVIKPRDPGYDERAKTGKVDNAARKKNKK